MNKLKFHREKVLDKYKMSSCNVSALIEYLQYESEDLPADVHFDVETRHGYYVDIETDFTLSWMEEETDEAFELRKKSIEQAAKKRKIAAAKAEITKAQNERKLYEELKKKYEDK